MFLRKVVSVMLMAMIVFTIFASSALAYDICDVVVDKKTNKECGKRLSWVNSHQSIKYDASHTYTVQISGVSVTKSCKYQYYNQYKNYKCDSGHIVATSTTKVSIGHQCGL